MTDSRQKILQQIQKSFHRNALTPAQEHELAKRFSLHPRGVLPRLEGNILEIFIDKAKKSLAHVELIHTLAEIPKLLLNRLSKPVALKIATSSELTLIPWNNYPEIIMTEGAAIATDKISMTTCLCGVAETGTLVLLSSPQSPTTLNFLTEIHIVLLAKQNIVAHYEDAWDIIREQNLDSRTVNFITGPSRTGDIEQTMQIGVHGPKEIYILLYDKIN